MSDPSLSREPALDASNKGFQMLQSAGWCEGTGLGAGGQGVVAPVSVVPANENGQGVGTTETHAVTQDDDEFDQYRKRMMLAYRFRPNPLNSACRTCVVLCLNLPTITDARARFDLPQRPLCASKHVSRPAPHLL